MPLYRIDKSNASGRWFAGHVNATTALAALADARHLWPSRNAADQFHASLVDEAGLVALTQELWSRAPRAQDRPHTYADRCAERRVAYLERNRRNVQRGLNRNVERAGLTPAITRVAESIDARFQQRIEAEGRR